MRFGLSSIENFNLIFATFFSFAVVDLQGQMSEIPPIPNQMNKLAFFEGNWENESIFLDSEGRERKRSRFQSEVYPVLNRRAYEMKSFYENGEAGRSLLFYHLATNQYVMVALDAWGNYDEFVGNFENEKLILTSKDRVFKNGKSMMWRRTYYNFGEKQHEIVMHYSLDQGKTWIISNRQTERKTVD